MIYSFYCK